MENISINFWSVLVAAAAYMILGALWYSPILFGNSWMRVIGKSREQIEKDFSPMNYLWAFVAAFLGAYGIARLMLWSGGSTMADGAKIGLVAGVCFIIAAIGINDIFEGRPRKLTLINAFYHLTGLIVAGIVIGAW